MGAPEEEFREPSPGFSELIGKWGQREKEAEHSKPYFARIGKSLSSGSDASSTPDTTVSATNGTTVHRSSAPAAYRKPTRQNNPLPTVVCSPTQSKKKQLIYKPDKAKSNDERCDAVPLPLLDMTEDELYAEAATAEAEAASEPVNNLPELAPGLKGPRADRKVSHTWTNLLRTSKQIAFAKRKIKQKRAKLHNVFASKLSDDTAFVPPVFAKSLIETKMLQIAMKSNFVFHQLDKLTLDTLAAAFEQVEFSAGETIIQQGDKGDYFYAVKHGEVDFLVDQVKVGSARTGKSFGELALLYTCLRAATVKASSSSSIPKTTLFRIDQKCFRYVLKNQLEDLEKVKLKLLRKIKAFQKVDTKDLKVMVPAMEPHIFEKGDVVWTKEGGASQPFFVVQEGELSFTNRTVGDKTEKDKKLGPGDYFGALGSGQKDLMEAGTVTALSRVLAFTIDRDLLEQDLGGVKRLMNKSMDKRNLSLMASVIKANINDDGLNTLAEHVVEITFEAGCPIFEKGNTVVPAIYLVRKGKVKLVRPDGTTEEIIDGGSFGQELKEDEAKAEYSATALERTTCGVLSLPDCPVVFDQHMIAKEAERYTPSTDLRLEDLTRHRLLGEGQFGQVFLVSSKKEKDPKGMALKIQSRVSDMRPDMVKAVWDEIKSMQRLEHGLLVSLITTFECAKNIYMLLTLAHGGELFDVIHQEDGDGEFVSGIGEKGKFYAAVVADALAFVHRQKFVYRDLKPENVLIDEVGYPVLTDFGFAKCIDDNKTFTFCGTPNYLPPEVITNAGHDFSADNWSLGVLIYELIEGENPFYYQGMDQMALFEAICTEKYYPLAKEVSPEAMAVIEKLLEKNPSKRLGTFRENDILSHPWFSSIDMGKLRKKEIEAPWVPDPLSLDEA